MNSPFINIALFASGSGSNFQAIVDAIEKEKLPITIALLVCDNPSAFVIERAHKHQIETLVLNPKSYNNKEEYEQVIDIRQIRVETPSPPLCHPNVYLGGIGVDLAFGLWNYYQIIWTLTMCNLMNRLGACVTDAYILQHYITVLVFC